MADIQQWRRKIQPARSRTPAPFHDIDDFEDHISTTPRKRIKPKLSAYFGNNGKPTVQEEVATVDDFPSWPPDQVYPDPKPEELVNAMMCRIMSSPYQALETSHHSSLMMIFESYGQLLEEKAQVQQRQDADAATIRALVAKLDEAEAEWNEEKFDFKDEVKRLEVLLAKESKRGMAEVTLARQDSKLRHRMSRGFDKKETIFEFLEKSNLRDDRYHSQRGEFRVSLSKISPANVAAAIMKPILMSVNDKDKQTSQQQLTQKKSMTHLHTELPFGTPPLDTRSPLPRVSNLVTQQHNAMPGRKRATTASTTQSTSEDTFSTFSSESDIVPDHTLRPVLKQSSGKEDYASIEAIATTLAIRRNIDPARVMPQLLQLFNAQHLQNDRVASDPMTLGAQIPYPQRSSSMIASVDSIAPKHRTVMSKASGFFQKLVPQLSVDMHTGHQPFRRFSFEPGDDTEPADTSIVPSNSNEQDRSLRRSVSASALKESRNIASARPLSPVAHSPTPSALVDGRFGLPSRIPTPVFSSGSVARPRQEREDSIASLLTVIKYNDAKSVINSRSGSPESTRSNVARAGEEVLAVHAPNRLPSSDSSSRVNSLHGLNLATAAARTASSEADASPKVQFDKRARSEYSPSGYTSRLTSAILRTENARPST